MLKHICFANEKMKAEKHRMISLKCGKTRCYSEYARLFVFYNEKFLKSHGGQNRLRLLCLLHRWNHESSFRPLVRW